MGSRDDGAPRFPRRGFVRYQTEASGLDLRLADNSKKSSGIHHLTVFKKFSASSFVRWRRQHGGSGTQTKPNGTPAGQYNLTVAATAGSSTPSLQLKFDGSVGWVQWAPQVTQIAFDRWESWDEILRPFGFPPLFVAKAYLPTHNPRVGRSNPRIRTPALASFCPIVDPPDVIKHHCWVAQVQTSRPSSRNSALPELL